MTAFPLSVDWKIRRHKYNSNSISFSQLFQPSRSKLHSNMSLLPTFHVSPSWPGPGHVVATGPAAPPLMLCLDFSASSHGNIPDNAKSPATLRSQGSFNYNRERGGFSLEWASLAKFDTWRRTEEHASSIELVASTTQTDRIHWSRWQKFVCGRQESGGRTYKKKNPQRQRTLEPKKTGCGCYVIVKQYLHMSTLLGRYDPNHDHEIGAANIAYTCLSGTTWERIKMMLTQTIDRSEIMSC